MLTLNRLDHGTTDIYPTRYTAFDRPGEIVRFQPAPDGTFRHCRADATPAPVETLSGVYECIVFSRPRPDRRQPGNREGYDYAEARPTKRGAYVVELQRDGEGRNLTCGTLDDAETLIRRFADDDRFPV